MTLPAKETAPDDIMESLLIKGDLAKLTPNERAQYYLQICRDLGLNPRTKPMDYIVLNGKLQLYALRTCTDQLRKINNVSLEVVSRDVADDILTVHVRARMPDGRSDEDLGAVAFPPTLRGDARANAELKAVTKAKRRVTLSICGLGWLDETEVTDIPASAKRPPPPGTNVMLAAPEPPHDTDTGEILDPESPAPSSASREAGGPQPSDMGPAADTAPASPSPSDAGALTPAGEFIELDRKLANAAPHGSDILKQVWDKFTPAQKKVMKQALDRRHKRVAELADAEIENELAARDDA